MRILHGLDRQALIDHCLREINQMTKLWPDKRAFLILPEALKADHEQRYIKEISKSSLMMVEILSFTRFAYRLFAEAGGLAQPRIAMQVKPLLLQKLIREEKNQFLSLSSAVGKYREMDVLIRILDELARADLDSDDLRASLDDTTAKSTQEKILDLAKIKEVYEAELAKLGLLDSNQEIKRASMLLASQNPRLDFLANTEVWIAGFGQTRDFSQAEYDLIKALQKRLAKLTICVQETHREENFLVQIASNFPGALLEALPDNFNKFQRTMYDLALAEYYPFAKPKFKFDDKVMKKGLLAVKSASNREQFEFIAAQINHLVVNESYQYREIAIALAEPNTMSLCRSVLADYNLAFHSQGDQAVAQTALVLHLSALFNLCIYGQIEALLALFKADLSGLSFAQQDRFENFCLAYGIKHLYQLKYSQNWPEEILEILEKKLEPILKFKEKIMKLDSPQKISQEIQDYCNLLYPQLQHQIASLDQRGEAISALALAKSWESLSLVLGEIPQIFAKEQVKAKDFLKLLDDNIWSISFKSIPLGLNKIRLGSIDEIMLYPCKILFVCSLSSDNLPARVDTNSYLEDYERELIVKKREKHLSILGEDQYHFARYAALTLLTVASESIYLLSAEVEESRPRLMRSLERQYPEILLDLEKNLDLKFKYFSLKRIKRAFRMKEALPLVASFELDEDLMTSYFSALESLSVSRIEKYNSCPYLYFLDYILVLKKRPIADIDPLNRGNLVHSILELAVLDLVDLAQKTNQKEAVQTWAQTLNLAYVEKLFEQAILAYQGYEQNKFKLAEDSSYINQKLREACLNFLEKTAQYFAIGQAFPYQLEYEFASDALGLKYRGRSVLLKGKIDRIDRGEEQDYIIDYKTGSNTISFSKIISGESLQILVYGLVWQGLNQKNKLSLQRFLKATSNDKITMEKVKMKAESLARYENSFVIANKEESKDPDLVQAREEVLAAFVKEKVQASLDELCSGEIQPRYDSASCEYCSYKSLCLYREIEAKEKDPIRSARALIAKIEEIRDVD